jgi:hypothetical protein
MGIRAGITGREHRGSQPRRLRTPRRGCPPYRSRTPAVMNMTPKTPTLMLALHRSRQEPGPGPAPLPGNPPALRGRTSHLPGATSNQVRGAGIRLIVTASTQTKVAIGIAAVVWFIVAILTNQTVSTTALKTISIAVSAATIIFLLYDRFIWKVAVVRAFTGKPLVAGTWRGTLQSDYVRPGESDPIPPIPAVIRVTQTDSTLLVTLFTGESQSVTEQGRIVKEADGRWRMSWLYVNNPRPSLQHRSNVHHGVCDLYLSGSDGEALVGQYFTSRKTTGEIRFAEWSKHSYGDAASALAGSDFGTARPFCNWPRR